MSDLTAVCAWSGKGWKARAERALASVRRYAPDVETRLLACRPDVRLARCLAEGETPWLLFLDADVLCTGDVRPLLEQAIASGCRLMARRSPLHGHPQWSHLRWRRLLARYSLPERHLVWNGAMLVRREAAEAWVPRIPVWRKRYLDYEEQVFRRRHKKPDQHSITLALAGAGILDEDTCWVGPEAFSWHSREGELGIVHHFNGEIYAELEAAGRLESAIEERRPARVG